MSKKIKISVSLPTVKATLHQTPPPPLHETSLTMWASGKRTGEMTHREHGSHHWAQLLATFSNVAPLYVSQALAQGAVTVSAVMAGVMVDNMGYAAWIGVPNLCMSLASTLSANFFGLMMMQRGRQLGLFMAFVLGAFGTLVGFAGAYIQNIWLFLLGTMLVGASQGGYYQARYAVAENVPEQRRGTALGAFMLASVVGAVLTTWLLGPIGALAKQLGTDTYIAGWVVGAVLLATSAVLIALWQPQHHAQSHAQSHANATKNTQKARILKTLKNSEAAQTTQAAQTTEATEATQAQTVKAQRIHWGRTLRMSGIRSTVLAMATSHGLMVSLMSLLPVRADNIGVSHHGVENMVIGHIVGMFGFGWLTGPLIDRLGVRFGYVGGALLLAASALVAPLSPQQPFITISMFLLGLGWNFVAVGGSKALAKHPAAQSIADSVSYFVAGVGSVVAGVVMAKAGFQTLVFWCAALSLLPLISAFRVRHIGKPKRRRLIPRIIRPR